MNICDDGFAGMGIGTRSDETAAFGRAGMVSPQPTEREGATQFELAAVVGLQLD